MPMHLGCTWRLPETFKRIHTIPHMSTRSANILRVGWGDSSLSSEVALNGLSNVYTYNVALGTAEEKVLAYAHWLQLEGRLWICIQGLRRVALLAASCQGKYMILFILIPFIYFHIYIAHAHTHTHTHNT